MIKKFARRILRLALGGLLVILGVFFCFIPVGQGILTIAAGLVLLAPDVPFLQRLGKKIEKRWPDQVAAIRRAQNNVSEKLRKRFGRNPPKGENNPDRTTKPDSTDQDGAA